METLDGRYLFVSDGWDDDGNVVRGCAEKKSHDAAAKRRLEVENSLRRWDNPGMKYLWLMLALSLFTAEVAAKEKHLPLPPQIVAAKTVYIDNQSGFAKLGDRAYEQLTKWGRFQVIPDRKQADLVLLMSTKAYDGGYITSGGGTTGTIDSSGNINTTDRPTYSRQVSVNYTFLTVVDPKTGEGLWSDSKKWGNLYTGFHSATKGLIDELMKRVNEEAPQNSGAQK
jgi:hypothetical protein